MGALGLGGLESWKSPAPNEVWTEWMISNDWMIHDEIHAPKWPLVTSSFHNIPFLDTTKERERGLCWLRCREKPESCPNWMRGWKTRPAQQRSSSTVSVIFFGHTLAHTHDTTRHRQDMTLLYFTDIHNHTHTYISIANFLDFGTAHIFFKQLHEFYPTCASVRGWTQWYRLLEDPGNAG